MSSKRRSIRPLLRSTLAIAGLLGPAIASAELYCVSTATQLKNAITAADASSSASEIRVKTGSYTFTSTPTTYALRIEGFSDLVLTGGWSGANCDTRTLNPEVTVLTTGGTGKLMSLEFPIFPSVATHTVEISGLSFRNSVAADLEAACLFVERARSADTDRATLMLDRNSFRLCTNTFDSSNAAALKIDEKNLNVYIRNNVFVDNAGYGGIAQILSFGNSLYYITNNTIANNPALNTTASLSGLDVKGADASSFFWVVNNVGWNNGNAASLDFNIGGFSVGVASANIFGDVSFISAGMSYVNNLASDPLFISSNDLRPRANSPMRNSGTTAAGGALNFDLSGSPRIQGMRIDRGAHEFDELLVNGFE